MKSTYQQDQRPWAPAPRLWNIWTETVTAIDLLKTGKAPGVDNILCELLKHGKEALKGPLTILFNKILISGKYPTLWYPRGKLFQKLRLAGVTGRFLEILHLMCSNDKSSVKIENVLSPTLFNF